jgi:hypothetical protein
MSNKLKRLIFIARICDKDGNFLPLDSPPPPRDNEHNWTPFQSRSTFELAELLFEKVEMSAGEVEQLLRVWAAHSIENNKDDSVGAPFTNKQHLLNTIDNISYGELSWQSFKVRYLGELTDSSPAWKKQTYTIYTRNSLEALRSMLANSSFEEDFDYRPFEEYYGAGKRRWSHLMSGGWAWRQAVSHI